MSDLKMGRTIVNIGDLEFNRITSFMLNSYGIDLSKKRVLVESRLRQLVIASGNDNYKDYLNAVFQNATLRQEMVTCLTTNYTYFYREDIHYEFMVKQALPTMMEGLRIPFNAKIWSAGCSAGDEAFTAAMFLRDYQAGNRMLGGFSITATDISGDMLAQAKQATYTPERLSKLPPEMQKKYFTAGENGKMLVKKELTDRVSFSELNLMDAFPPNFSGFDIIFCRNVMIYFTPEIRKKLGKKFLNALKPGGYLFIGLSETIPANEIGFKTIRPSIFLKEK